MYKSLHSHLLRIPCCRSAKPPWAPSQLRSFTMSGSRPKYQTLAELQQAYQGGKTVKEVTQQYLDIIESRKDLNAVTVVNHKALEEAQQLDKLAQEKRGPLFGLPIVVKDQIETAGIATAYGSKVCKDHIPSHDATLVRKLKEAGAVILAKTTMPDWAASWFSTSSLSETTKHPIDPSRDPGGSSSGSGTAVAAGLALSAIGGDTGGSIRLPASFCGLVGVRVTPGRISRDGMSSLVATQDTPGPMTRTVQDAARILDVLVGFDEKDDFTSINALEHQTEPRSFVNAIKEPVLSGRRLGVLRQAFGEHRGINFTLEKTLSELRASGVELIDVEIPDLEQLKEQTSVYVLRSRSDINSFLASRDALQHLKIEDLQEKGEYHQCLDLISALAKGPKDPFQSPHFSKALSAIQHFQRTVMSLYAKHKLDAIIYPTCQLLAPKTQDLLDLRWTCLNYPTNTVIASQLLWSAVSVPIGTAKDDEYPDDPELPVGLEILGLPLSEDKLLNLAAGIEAMKEAKS
ncbi:hypothetical protein CKM354_000115400 [Cercospora kikuchii]|uniref:Amidase domain-containing protein n=1 Tax=Cercospora kikuchii TaxID=84275 RepID=A0A9P3CAD5_9PEZI|nr:uncharacterized protein CKM354_000115400 [Cercospora kikuchii]GIZ37717.1 hypothetical protein CKM354_000115400 [Cercospora kikuchii]